MKVHSTLGNGFQEVLYQRALAIEMRRQYLDFKSEMKMSIFYDGIDIGTRRVDFFVEENIMVELKAVIKLEDAHFSPGHELLSGIFTTHWFAYKLWKQEFGIQESL